jgi:non-heme chloroperoxidase
MNFITTADKTRLYVKDWSASNSPATGNTASSPCAVVLMSGWPLSADSWDDQAMALAEAGHRVISYDRRGFGRSSQPFGGYDYDTLADDLAAVIDQTGVRDVSLMGFSMGGGEVARYMSRHDGRNVIKTALIASVVPFMLKTADNPNGTEQSVFDNMREGMLEDRAQFFAGFFKDFFGVTMLSHPVSQELIDWARGMAMQASLKATLECAKSFASTDFRPDLAAFTKPTLIIHGTDDKTVPIDASGRAAAAAIKQSTLIEYADAPHGLFATDKARLSSDLLAFLHA